MTREKSRRAAYTPEYKLEAVRLVEGGQSKAGTALSASMRRRLLALSTGRSRSMSFVMGKAVQCHHCSTDYRVFHTAFRDRLREDADVVLTGRCHARGTRKARARTSAEAISIDSS